MVVGRSRSSSLPGHIPLTFADYKISLPGLADQLDRARLEKMYEGAEQRLKQTTHVVCEPRLEASKRLSPLLPMASSLISLC